MNYDNEIPKYRKKAQHKAPKKSKHKHIYKDCMVSYTQRILGEDKTIISKATYCPICGKIGDIKMIYGYPVDINFESTEEARRMMEEDSKLPFFEIDGFFDKYVFIKEG